MRLECVTLWRGVGVAMAMSVAAVGMGQPERGQPERGQPERVQPEREDRARPERPQRAERPERGDRFVMPSELSDERRADLTRRLRSAADRVESGDEVLLVLREELPWLGMMGGAGVDRQGERVERGGRAQGQGPGQGQGEREGDGAEPRGPRGFEPLAGAELAAARAAIKTRFPALAEWIDVDGEVGVVGGAGGAERGRERGMEEAWVRGRVLRRAADLAALSERDADEAEVGFAELGARLEMMRAVRAYREATGPEGGADLSAEAAAREGVRAALSSLFDVRLQEKRLELSRLNERVARLIAETEKLEGTRSEFVEEKVEELARRMGGEGRSRRDR